MNRTKIVCTLGPACDDDDKIRAMIRAGMNVARINFSHGDHAAHLTRIERVRRIAQEMKAIIAVLGDLQGPKLRVGEIANGFVMTYADREIILTTREVPGDEHEVYLPHPDLVHDVKPGQRLLLDDGQLEFIVLGTTDTDIRCKVVNGGPLSSHKGVSAPGANLSLSALSDKDREDAVFGAEQQLDFLALSFVRTAEDVKKLRALLDAMGSKIPIVTKIEKAEALENFSEILSCSDVIMVARGDLGVETPAESVPVVQKELIRHCNARGVPVITATQMLNSMITQPRPTRAEASDVANAIYDGTDALMLSAETASGKYPVESVEMMSKIAHITEQDVPFEKWSDRRVIGAAHSIADAIGHATVEIAYELNAKAIVTSTLSGNTTRLLARFRPRAGIIAATPSEVVQRQLALVWGVTPILSQRYATTDDMIRVGVLLTVKNGLAQRGDTIIITAGIPATSSNHTNMLKVHVIGEGDGQ
ncbi:MAG TPA: pyruvate kinase [Anaerolineae bacterium]|nr:pyruvate kinase [Anaerolineae bacterium]